VRRAAPALALFLTAGAAFGVLLPAPAAYDDQVYLVGNPFHRQPPAAVARALASPDYFALTDERSWQPLVTALEAAAGGRPWPVRAVALAAWAGCGALTASLAAALGASPAAAFAAGMLLTLFPAAAEALAVASFSGHILALLGVLAAARLYLAGSAFGAAAALAAAFLAKESAVTALPVLALLAWREGLSPADALRRAAPSLGVAAAYASWRWGVLVPPPPIGDTAAAFHWTLPWQSLGFQLRHLALPWPLCLERSFGAAWDSERVLRFALPPAWLALLWAWRTDRSRAAALLWVGAASAPVLHLVPFANLSPAADRYLLAAAAPAALAAALWAGSGRRRSAALAAVALAFAALSFDRALLFLEPDALTAATEACAPEHPRALALRAAHLYGRGRYDEALPRFEKAFRLAPGLQAPFRDPGLFHMQGSDYVLGLVMFRAGRVAESEGFLRRAAAVAPRGPARAAALDRVGDVLLETGRPLDARAAYRAASSELPAWAVPYAKTAGTMTLAEAAEAVPYLEKALALSAEGTPEEAVFRREVGDALDRAKLHLASLSTAPTPK
jgi:tetratricopeptide (TPR) repeat protein